MNCPSALSDFQHHICFTPAAQKGIWHQRFFDILEVLFHGTFSEICEIWQDPQMAEFTLLVLVSWDVHKSRGMISLKQ